MTIRAVFWDMGGVLLRTQDQSGREQWQRRLQLPAGELERRVFESETARLATVGQADEAQIWGDLARSFGLNESERDQLAADFFAGDRIDQELVAFIRSLRPRLKTGVISNAWPGIRHYLEQVWRVADAFDTLVISAEVGLAKPDPAIYKLALDRLQVDASQSVFVDDFEINVLGAREVGMQAIHFRTAEQARADLERLLQSMDLGTTDG